MCTIHNVLDCLPISITLQKLMTAGSKATILNLQSTTVSLHFGNQTNERRLQARLSHLQQEVLFSRQQHRKLPHEALLMSGTPLLQTPTAEKCRTEPH